MAIEWIIVGLGNPGGQYERTRHNAGFWLMDALADAYKFPPFKAKYKAEIASGLIGDAGVLLLKPQTYMNLSGEAVQEAAHFFKIKPDRIIVAHDELDLAVGQLRTKLGGGAAGHNGLKSIDQCLGTQAYWRIRLGIGHPGDRDLVSPYVLSAPNAEDTASLQKLVQAAATALPFWFSHSAERFQSETARRFSA